MFESLKNMCNIAGEKNTITMENLTFSFVGAAAVILFVKLCNRVGVAKALFYIALFGLIVVLCILEGWSTFILFVSCFVFAVVASSLLYKWKDKREKEERMDELRKIVKNEFPDASDEEIEFRVDFRMKHNC